jgi:HAD superfamily hydrolase (TIGR01450 family)
VSKDLDALPERYRLILCDLWGCVHDGFRLLPGAEERLRRWRAEGRTVLFLTNAPRSHHAIRAHLARMSLPRELYDGIVTAGDVGIAALQGRPVGFCGRDDDEADLTAAGLVFTDAPYTEVACAGLWPGETVDNYRERLTAWREAEVLLHCLNPDRVVIHGDQRMICAGALADAYEALGGRVAWYGKPHPATYDHALNLAGNPPKEQVMAVGDGLHTDVLGAARYGIDCVYVAGGIHAGEAYPDDLTPGWRPLMVVETL